MMRRTLALALVACALLAISCSDDDGTQPPPVDTVDDYFKSLPEWQEFSPPMEDSEGETGPTEANLEFLDDQPYVCRITPCSITATPEAIVTLNPNTDILYVGSLIQGATYLGGLAAMEELPIRQRAPVTVSLDLTFPDNMRTVEDPTLATVDQAIAELVSAAHNAGHQAGSVLSYSEHESYCLEQSMLKLGMSASYLGSEVSGELSVDQSVETHTLMAYFKQRMFTARMVQPQTPGEMFSSEFTQDRLDEQVELGRIGPDNLPVYVSSIVYGRIMVMTMTSTHSVTEMRGALDASYENLTGDGDVELTQEQLDILETSDFRIVAVGGDATHALQCIQSGNLADYFDSDASLTSAVPLSYALRNLADNSIATVSETTAYDMRSCTEVEVEVFGDRDAWETELMIRHPEIRIEMQPTDAASLVAAGCVSSPPGEDQTIPAELVFPGANTGLPLDFTLVAIENSFNYNDDELNCFVYGPPFPFLSVGNSGVPDYSNDDFELVIDAVEAPYELLAVGITVGMNGAEDGEFLRIKGEGGVVLEVIPASSLPGMDPMADCAAFWGLISSVPITDVFFNEDPDDNHIWIRNPVFGLAGG